MTSPAPNLTKLQEAQQRYFRTRRLELLKEHPELETKRAQLQRMKSEWNLLTPAERRVYEKDGKNETGEEVGVDDYMDYVKEERKRDDINPEFEEDDVLSIVNHKSKWKLTYGRKKKVRISNLPSTDFRLN